MRHVYHQSSLFDDAFRLWLLSFELVGEGVLAAAELLGLSVRRHQQQGTQLQVPDPIAQHGEHNLFA
ncbi:hypothetical protein HJG53_05940 [Sphingomonas sp. ID1715]|uniref:hypothetical protein n=1 Tax=Sphingomonas sp. ID1715 TaxID=1656898 RepID=UPI001488750D|nr:hypothetical protein [Sphingomonas sp. ID1715]NNM76441.1 hypothetical protein [Sphingomonas sp. ID1715]